MAMNSTEAAVIGAGPAGLVAALALARSGIEVTLVAPPYEGARAAADRRTTALMGPSVELLKNLDVWGACGPEAAPIAAVRIADDREGVLRAPEVLFRASELGLESFGANVANPVLLAALHAAADRAARLTRVATAGVRHIEPGAAGVRLELAEGGAIAAALAVAADGRSSIAPAAAGIGVRAWDYRQVAIVTSFGHARSHAGIVNELHRHAGPLTTVPLPGRRSSLVWAEEPGEAQRIAGLDDGAFAAVLEERLQGLLGTVGDVEPRGLYPLKGQRAERMAAARIALVGEAAHVIPPIGAQGLNLGLRDAAALAECAAEALAAGEDIGGPAVLAAYERARSADVLARSVSIDLLNRSLLTDFLAVDALRGLAAHLLASFGPLRRLLMEGGMGATGDLPRLMRPNAPSPGP
jgi:2-octaprenyl-6-methoxyphenol hydroxylase